MQEDQRKKAEWRRNLNMLATILPPLVAFGIIWRYTPPWWPLPLVGILLLAAYDYRLLWKYPSPDGLPAGDLEAFLRWHNRWLRLRTGFFLNSLAGIFLLGVIFWQGLFRHWLNYYNEMVVLITSAGVGVLFPFILFLILRRKRQDLYADDRPPEVKEAFRDAARGWGMTPREALRQAKSIIWSGIAGAGMGCIPAVLLLIQPGSANGHYNQGAALGGWAFLCLSGLLFVVTFFVARPYLSFWRQWRDQPEERLAIQGKIVDWWMDDAHGDKTLIKVQRSNGSSKLLLVSDDLLPEDESKEVRVEYLYGIEAVLSVETLASDEEAEETP